MEKSMEHEMKTGALFSRTLAISFSFFSDGDRALAAFGTVCPQLHHCLGQVVKVRPGVREANLLDFWSLSFRFGDPTVQGLG